MKIELMWFLTAALLSTCATTGTKASAKQAVKRRSAAEYYPLQVGTRWKYTGSMFGDRALEVTMLKVEDGFSFDSTGAQFAVDAYGVRDQKRYLIRNPIEVGNKWRNVVSPSAIEYFEIVGIDQTCDTPLGLSHECVEVEARNRTKENEFLIFNTVFAPGVGIVRFASVLEAQGKLVPQTSMNLVDFTAAPAADAGVR